MTFGTVLVHTADVGRLTAEATVPTITEDEYHRLRQRLFGTERHILDRACQQLNSYPPGEGHRRDDLAEHLLALRLQGVGIPF